MLRVEGIFILLIDLKHQAFDFDHVEIERPDYHGPGRNFRIFLNKLINDYCQ
jgi:hypothetical protein